MKLSRVSRFLGLLALACPISAVAGINSWTLTGPDAGVAYTMAIHPTNSQIAVVATNRGLYRTADGGANWVLANEYVHHVVSSIAFDPTNPNRVFAARGELLRSDDAGQTFTVVANPVFSAVYNVGFTSTGTLYVASMSSQVFRSTNQGSSWTACALPTGLPMNSSAFAVDPNPNAPDRLFMAAHDGSGITSTWRSTDSCASWTRAGSGDPGATASGQVHRYSVMPGDSNRVLAATDLGVTLSTDGGATWNYTILTNAWDVRFDPTPAGNGDALAIVGAGTVIASTDGGANWIARGSLYALGHAQLAFDPLVNGRVFGLSNHGPYLSTDGGDNFALRNGGMRAGIVSRLTAADDGTVYTTFGFGASGVFRRDPVTQMWGPVPNEDLLAGIAPPPHYISYAATAPSSSANLYAAIGSGLLVRSTNGGTTWAAPSTEFIVPAATLSDTVVDPDDAMVAYTATTNRGIWKTVNGGATWAQLTNGIPLETFRVAAAPGANVVYVTTGLAPGDFSPKTIYKSIDGGASWAITGFPSLPPGTGSPASIVIDPANIDVLYVPTYNGIHKSVNGGATWQLMSFPGVSDTTFLGYDIVIDPVHPTTMVASSTIDGAGLARTVDGGLNWRRIHLSLPGGQLSGQSAQFEKVVLDPQHPHRIIASVRGANLAEYDVATDLAVSILGVPPTVARGANVSGSVLVENRGPHAASPAQLTIVLPAWIDLASVPNGCVRAAQTLTCRVPPLQISMSALFSLPLRVNVAGGTGALTATVVGHEAELTSANDSATVNLTATEQADLALTLTPFTTVLANQASTSVSARLENRGPSGSTATTLRLQTAGSLQPQSANPSRGSCTIVASTVDCSLGAIIAGEVVTVSLLVVGSAPGAGTVTGEADGAGTDTGTDQNAVASISVLPRSEIRVSLAESADPVQVDNHYTHTATVTNDGPDTSNPVTLTLQLSSNAVEGLSATGGTCSRVDFLVTCQLSPIAAGASATATVALRAPAPAITTTTAGVSFAGFDSDYGNNGATIGTTLRNVADLSVEIQDGAGPGFVIADEPYSYLITARNAGPTSGTGTVAFSSGATVMRVESPHANCSNTATTVDCTLLAFDIGTTRTFQVFVNGAPIGTVESSATISLNGVDPNPANDVATRTTIVRGTSDVSLELTDSADPVIEGTPFNYLATIRNLGAVAGPVHFVVSTTGVNQTSATVPGGTCSVTASQTICDIASLGAGASAVITIAVATPNSATATVTALVTYGGRDPAQANNEVSTTTTISRVASGGSSGGATGGGAAGKKGGGSLDWLGLLLLGSLAAARRVTPQGNRS